MYRRTRLGSSTGLRVQYWPTEKLKIEPWFINGWQTYGRYNSKPGLGGQILYRPKPYLDFVWNNYGVGQDDAGFPGRTRIHADYSAQIKFYDKPKNMLDKIAFTVTGDLGCEMGGGPSSFAETGGTLAKGGASPEKGNGVSTYNGGVNCHNFKNGEPKQEFEGWMDYLRFWFNKDVFAVTLGGGQMSNPGRYLTLLPPINGATASTGSPYFTENAGDQAQMRDGTITLDYMPGSSSPSGLRKVIATPMCRTGLAAGASRPMRQATETFTRTWAIRLTTSAREAVRLG